jgi:hypothetical protein
MGDDPLEQLKAMKATPSVDPLEQLKALHAPKKTPLPGVSGHPIVDASPDEEPGIGTKILGTAASLGRDIPGVEAAQSGIRALVRREPYRQAREEIRGAEESAPAIARVPARLVGGTLSAMAIPGSPLVAGGTYGALSAALSSNPDANPATRQRNVAIEGTLGALGGKAAEAGGSVLRALKSSLPDAAILARSKTLRATDNTNFAKAVQEGKDFLASLVTKTTPDFTLADLRSALDAPDIKPFANFVRGQRQFANADEPTVLRETFKLMSKEQGGLMRRLRQTGFDAETQMKADNIGLAKQQLLDVADKVMPSFRKANEASAAIRGETDTFKRGLQSGRNVVMGTQPGVNRMNTQGAEQFRDAIPGMSPDAASTNRDAILSVLKSRMGADRHLTHGFGIFPSLARASRAGSVLRGLDQQTGSRTSDILRSFGITAATPTGQ